MRWTGWDGGVEWRGTDDMVGFWLKEGCSVVWIGGGWLEFRYYGKACLIAVSLSCFGKRERILLRGVVALFKDRGVRHTGVRSPEGPLFPRSGALGSIIWEGWSS